MAQITINVSLNDAAARRDLEELRKSIEAITATSSNVQVNKDITAQTNAIAESYTDLANAATQASKAEKEHATAENQTRQSTKQTSASINQLRIGYANLLIAIQNLKGKYPKGTFDEIEQGAKKSLDSLHGLTAGTDGYSDKVRVLKSELQNLRANFAETRQSTEQVTTAVVKSGDSVLTLAKKFVLWQLSATFVMKPIRWLTDGFNSLNDTLVTTEDTVIALKRALTETIADSELSGKLYDIAEKYGQTFENISEIAATFARSGLSWNDTLSATEAAVLALNVAELNSTEASSGLIAVMSQFDLQATDLITVIDELNKTADNFPVTTEKLLAALQRTGSAASNANLSLEQTIGIITALSKATGRSGENIGTALNSLINYSSKQRALDTYASLSDNMARIVAEYRKGAASILDIWIGLSQEINHITDEQADVLDAYFKSEEGTELYQELSAVLGELSDDVAGVYSTASTFRKNYFIALLKDIDTAMEAQQVAATAEGYSLKENEQYLDSHTAKVNTLKAKWQEVANDEQGLLIIKKLLVDSGTVILNIIQWTGGLHTTFLALASVISIIFGATAVTKIQEFSLALNTNIKSMRHLISLKKSIKVAEQEATAATEKATVARAKANNSALEASVREKALKEAEQQETYAAEANARAKQAQAAATAALISYILIAITVTSIIIGYVNQHAEAEKERRQEIIQTWEAEKDEADSLAALRAEYEKFYQIQDLTVDQRTEFSKIQESIIDNLGKEANKLKSLDSNSQEYLDTLRGITEEKLKQYRQDAKAAAIAAKGEYDTFEFSDYNALGRNVYLGKTDSSEDIKAFSNLGGSNTLSKYGITTNIRGYGISANYKVKANLFENVQNLQSLLDYFDSVGYEGEIYSKVYSLLKEAEPKIEDLIESVTESVLLGMDYPTSDADKEGAVNSALSKIKTNLESTFGTTLGSDSEILQTVEQLAREFFGLNEEIKDTSVKTSKIVTDLKNISDTLRDEILSALSEAKGEIEDANKLLDLQNDLLEAQKNLQEAIAQARRDYVEQILDNYIKGEENALTLEEKLLAVEEARQALANAKNERTVRVYNQSTGGWEWQVDQKEIASAEDKLQSAISSLNEWLQNQAIEEIKQAIQDGSANQGTIKQILSKWLGQGDNSDGSLTKWGDGLVKAVTTAIKSGNYDQSAIQSSIDKVRQAVEKLNDYYTNSLWDAVSAAISNGTSNSKLRDIIELYQSKGASAEAIDSIIQTLKLAGFDLYPTIKTGSVGGGRVPLVSLYDEGGFLNGLGGIKATSQPETVLPPELTQKILSPVSNENFSRFASSLGLLFGVSNTIPSITRGMVSNVANSDNHSDNRTYQVNGVPIPADMANSYSLADIFRLIPIAKN